MTKGDRVIVQDGGAQRYARMEARDDELIGVWLDGQIRWFHLDKVRVMAKNAALHSTNDGEDCRS